MACPEVCLDVLLRLQMISMRPAGAVIAHHYHGVVDAKRRYVNI